MNPPERIVPTGSDEDLLTRIRDLEDLADFHSQRLGELQVKYHAQKSRADRLAADQLRVVSRIDRIVEHAGVRPEEGAFHVRPGNGRLFPEALPSGVEPAPTWANVFLVSVASAAVVALLFGWLGVGR